MNRELGSRRLNCTRALVAFGLAAVCRPAGAQEPASERLPFRAAYVARGGCAPIDEFSRQVLQRSQHAIVAGEGERAYEFALEIAQGAHLGRLTMTEPDGQQTVRTVRGKGCDDVLPALALIGALLLDPEASTKALPAPTPPVRQKPSSPPVPERSPSFRAGAGIGGGVESGVAPHARAAISLEVSSVRDSAELWSPLFALSINRTLSESVQTPGGVADFSWFAFRFSGCPLRLPASGAFALRPCALFDAGLLQGEGKRTNEPRHANVAWLAGGAAARAELSILHSVVLTLEGGVLAPVSHDIFYFSPERDSRNTPFQVPAFGEFGFFRVSTRFE